MEGMHDVFGRLAELRLVPVIKLPEPQLAVPLAQALLAGGLPCAEITFRTAAAADAIALIAECFPELLVGAGTILTPEQAEAAASAGARFVVSPGTNPAVLKRCAELGVPAIPGACTPTEIEAALALGVVVVKFFPASVMGGVAALKAFAGPYPAVRYVPTGGIDASNMSDYLALPQVLAVAGSWMVEPRLLVEGRHDEVSRRVREAVAAAGRAGSARGTGDAP